jgi:hypothetical protein
VRRPSLQNQNPTPSLQLAAPILHIRIILRLVATDLLHGDRPFKLLNAIEFNIKNRGKQQINTFLILNKK